MNSLEPKQESLLHSQSSTPVSSKDHSPQQHVFLDNIREFGSNISVLIAVGIGLLANIANWALIFFTIKPDQEQIALHYSPFYGADVFGDWGMVYRIPILGICILALHLCLGYVFYKKERLATMMLLWAACCLQIFFLIATITIVYINQPLTN